MNILVVEDDELTSWFVKRVLKTDGHFAQIVSDGQKGFEKAQSPEFDAIILDVLLPSKNGVQICSDLRRLRITTPILILSSKSSEEERITGLDAGADDYMAKPFSYQELRARIRAITRRPSIILQSNLTVGGLTLDPEKREVTRDGQSIRLRPKEYELLEYMMRNPNSALTRRVLLKKVWGVHGDNSSNRLEVHIRQLRTKIDKPFSKKMIKTVHNVGYKLVT